MIHGFGEPTIADSLNVFLNALQPVMRDDDDDQRVCCEWSYEEDTSRISNHVYEYQQMQMKEDIDHIDKDDDRLPKGNADEKDDEEIIDDIFITDAEKSKTRERPNTL